MHGADLGRLVDLAAISAEFVVRSIVVVASCAFKVDERRQGRRPPHLTDDVRILDAKRHLGCVFHLRTPGVSTMIGFSKKI